MDSAGGMLELLPYAAEQDAAAALLSARLVDRDNVGRLRASLGFHLEHDWRRFLAILTAAWTDADTGIRAASSP